jgi:hypothetical protein
MRKVYEGARAQSATHAILNSIEIGISTFVFLLIQLKIEWHAMELRGVTFRAVCTSDPS